MKYIVFILLLISGKVFSQMSLDSKQYNLFIYGRTSYSNNEIDYKNCGVYLMEKKGLQNRIVTCANLSSPCYYEQFFSFRKISTGIFVRKNNIEEKMFSLKVNEIVSFADDMEFISSSLFQSISSTIYLKDTTITLDKTNLKCFVFLLNTTQDSKDKHLFKRLFLLQTKLIPIRIEEYFYSPTKNIKTVDQLMYYK